MKKTIQLTINQKPYQLETRPDLRLLDVLRDELHLTGVKEGCSEGECGACTVLIDGEPADYCLVLIGQLDGSHITTIEGLKEGEELHPLQEAFIKAGAVQCGYCTPGMILSAKALLDKNADPDLEDIKKSISGNLCRCTGYQKIVQAIKIAAQAQKEQKEGGETA